MTWPAVGDKCVCIKEVINKYWKPGHPAKIAKVGGVYTVRQVQAFGNIIGILLEEIVNPIGDPSVGFNGETGFMVSYFRPLIMPTVEDDVQMFKRIADQVPNMEEA